MVQPWWQRDQIISAFIVGSFSLTATLVSLYINSRLMRAADDKAVHRRRRLTRSRATVLIAGLFATVLAVGAALLRPIVREAESPADLLDRLSVAAIFGAVTFDSAAEGPGEADGAAGDSAAAEETDAPAATEPEASESAAVALTGWLRAEGTLVRYRHAEYLPDGCADGTVVKGNWPDGWYEGVPVRCEGGGWLSFDIAPLVENGRIARNLTYCFNVQDATGGWARHGLMGAPGLESIAIGAGASGSQAHRNLGFRVKRVRDGDQVVFTREYPRAPC